VVLLLFRTVVTSYTRIGVVFHVYTKPFGFDLSRFLYMNIVFEIINSGCCTIAQWSVTQKISAVECWS